MNNNDSSSDSNVSIHSIVTDKDDFNSGNEAPEDKVGQVDKIIKNHVTKQILMPGKGLSKASKNDYVTISYKCYYPSNELIMDYYESNPIKQYIYNLNLPKGIISSILQMRLGEKSRIVLQPKYGFRKVNKEDVSKFIEIKHLSFALNDVTFQKMKTTPIIYEITLIDLKQFYDISGNRKMMKYIINRGDGILKPSDGNEVLFNFKLNINEEVYINSIEERLILDEDNFADPEIVIFKSLKKKEFSKIEISFLFFQELLKQNKGYICKKLKDKINFLITDDTSNKYRIIVEIELIKFNHSMKTIMHKNVDYNVKTLNKGIGFICPWKNSLSFISLTVKINDIFFFSSIDQNDGDFITRIKDTKKKIKLITNFEKNLQEIIEGFFSKGLLGSIDGIVIDPINGNLPCIFTKEIIPKLKLLESVSVKFKSSLDYLKIKEKEIINDSEVKEYEFIITLLSFQEKLSIFNKNASNEEQLKQYKTQANYFFNKVNLSKSKQINKYLVDEYIKYINLEKGTNKLTRNQKDFNSINLKDNNFEDERDEEIYKEMKKIISNLIMIYYRTKKYKKCDELMSNFFIIFDNDQKDEKVLCLKYKVLLEGFNLFEEAKLFLEKLINLHSNSSNINEYKSDLEIAEKKILDNKKNKNLFVKKMFKFE